MHKRIKNFKKEIDNHETLWYNQKITEMSKGRKTSSKKVKKTKRSKILKKPSEISDGFLWWGIICFFEIKLYENLFL